MNDYSINAVITLDTSDYKKGISEAQKSTKSFSGNFSKLTKGLGGALLKGGAIGLGITAVTKGLQALSKTVKESIKVWEDASAQQKKLGQTLKATGADAWTTTEELNAMADAYQKATNYSSDDITKMQTVLLGFKNVSQDTFQSASDAILDMAEVMGMDLVSATQTVGKALDDPINGLGSLSRQGFKFSEAEKELIQNLVEAGESAKAQKIILDELNTTYGGASKAGVKASTQLKNAWKDVVKELGRGITLNIDVGPAIQKLQKLIDDFKRVMQENNEATELTDKLLEAEKAIEQKTATDEQVILVYENKIKLMEQEYRQYEGLLGIEDEYAREGIARLDEEKKYYEWQIENAKKRIELYEYLNQKAEERKNKAIEEENTEIKIANLKKEHLEAIAEQVAEWDRIKQITGEEVSLEEKLKFYQDDLLAIVREANGQITTQNEYYQTQLAIIESITAEIQKQHQTPQKVSNEWADKLTDQTIERLEAEKEAMLGSTKFALMTAEQKYQAEKELNDKILEMKIAQLEAEKELALKGVEQYANAEEEKANISEYYANLIDDLQKKYATPMRGSGVQAGSEFGEGFEESAEKVIIKETLTKIIDAVEEISHKIVNVLKNTFKNMVKFAKSTFKKLFDFNIDDALDNLLVFEDKVLTFFIETLPNLPAFFESALQSISVMMSNIKLSIDKKKIKKLITDMIKAIKTYIPDILQMGMEIAKEIIEGFSQGIAENKAIIGEVLNNLANVIVQYLPDVLLAIIDALSTLISTIPNEMLVKIINGVIDLFTKISVALIQNAVQIAEKLIPALFEIMTELFKKFPEILKTVLWEAIKGLGKIATTIWNSVKKLFGFEKGTNNAPKGMALVGEAGPELVNFKGGEQVLNAKNTQKALASAGASSNNFTVNFNNTIDTTAYAMMQQLRQYNRQMAINGII